MTKLELEQKIIALEKRIAELEARPMISNHYHTHYEHPKFEQPYVPYVSPAAPEPWTWAIGDLPNMPITWGGTSAAGTGENRC